MREPIGKVRQQLSMIDLLQVGLILLKVADLINWSWWQVFVPTIVIIVAAIITGIIDAFGADEMDYDGDIDLEDVASRVVISIPMDKNVSSEDISSKVIIRIPTEGKIDWEHICEKLRELEEDIRETQEELEG